MKITPHSLKQEEAIFSEQRIVLCCTGVQWGKSLAGACRMKIAVCQPHTETDTFIIAAPTYKIMKQSTLPAFAEIMRGLGTYHAVDAVWKLPSGAQIFMRTGTEPDSVVGIRNCRHIWLDEAGKCSLYFWENLQARAAPRQAGITLTTTPYALNWIYKELIRGHERGERHDVHLCQATSAENPYFPIEEYERRKKTMDPRRFKAIFGGEFSRMEGLVYPFDEMENTCDPLELFPVGTEFVGGIDWGFTDPFVILVRAITPDGRHYQVSEFYRTGMTVSDMVRAARSIKDVWGVARFYCDPSQPGHILEFNRAGLTAIPADNDIRRGIDLHYELVRSRRFKVYRGSSPHSVDEYETYHWPEPKELKPDQHAPDEKPVDQSNHCSDAARYTTIMTFRLGSERKRAPKLSRDAA